MESVIRLTGDTEEIAAIVSLSQQAKGFQDASEPSALDASKVLNCGLTADDIKTALDIVTLVFTSGEALFGFLTSLRDYLRSRGSAIGVSNLEGKPLGRVDAETSDSALARLVP